jgi:hypothetical protein
MNKPSNAWRVFGAPAAVALLTLTGLVAGLLWSEGGRYLSWACVGSPVAVVVRIWLRIQLRRRSAAILPARCRRG